MSGHMDEKKSATFWIIWTAFKAMTSSPWNLRKMATSPSGCWYLLGTAASLDCRAVSQPREQTCISVPYYIVILSTSILSSPAWHTVPRSSEFSTNRLQAEQLQWTANPSCSLFASGRQTTEQRFFFSDILIAHCSYLQSHRQDAVSNTPWRW
jgi:hypothetical protein